MRILYYDCFSGISGDMNLGAMIDLGVDKDYLISELLKLNLEDEYKIEVRRDIRKGIEGTKADVILKVDHDHHDYIHGHDHQHSHGDSHEHYQHCHEHNHHIHRNLNDIEDIINSSSLSDNVKKLSLNMFMKVAHAESKVHGKSLYQVHFHEVGAVDSIVDIVGAAICLDYLKVDKIMASSIELGGGFVKCAHGLIPVPAPATVEILKGIPVKSGIVPFETTTPTGAAILAANVNEFTDMKEFTIEKIGYGVGERDTDIPNVLRVYLAKKKVEESTLEECLKDECSILECNIDDMNPEIYQYLMEKLFNAGALDVYKTSIMMKKNRPGTMLRVICEDNNKTKLVEILLKETTTFGVREYKVLRTKLKRDFSRVNTIYGEVNVKNAYFKGRKIKWKAEYEDCKRLAEENNIPLKNIYDEVLKNVKE
ncbi:nickel pincer cofactor biosynthesis protein LarC [Clostridium sp. ZS2-4]|uniref:nickel pincer cofactor biosynthesis protein LarC n=1 Tax=Clostridium sp. ZS2-4 TaxID=2987703 RepID=UPI00227C78B3|nr:nickel pincer cofactor biosynthesis protein LarC [Clostridium sp. ZS2-4]MCY6355032.1 nickel pincer cofactor biosynthesis protein LarC [Clostridium sp. ZS2-4]